MEAKNDRINVDASSFVVRSRREVVDFCFVKITEQSTRNDSGVGFVFLRFVKRLLIGTNVLRYSHKKGREERTEESKTTTKKKKNE